MDKKNIKKLKRQLQKYERQYSANEKRFLSIYNRKYYLGRRIDQISERLRHIENGQLEFKGAHDDRNT